MRIQSLPQGVALLFLAGAGCLSAQPGQPAGGARQMYYFGANARKDPLPPVRQAAAQAPQPRNPPPTDAPPQAAAPAVVHLGLRYNLALVNPDTNASTPADSSRTFRKGECVAIDLQANRSAYLYVMAKQSDGNWIPLIPSAEMPAEVNVLDPGMKVRAPKGYCFEIEDPPGTDTLVVILSRDPRDFHKLYEGMQGSSSPTAEPRPAPKPAAAVQLADARLVNSAVEQMSQQFGGTRNLAIRRVAQPEAPEEPQYSVYVVNQSDRPSATLVARIEINHR